MPKTNLGKWTLILIGITPTLIILGSILANYLYPTSAAGNTIIDDFSTRPLLAGSMVLAMAAGVSAFVAGLLAITRANDRSIIVILSTIAGGLFTIFLIAELVFPN